MCRSFGMLPVLTRRHIVVCRLGANGGAHAPKTTTDSGTLFRLTRSEGPVAPVPDPVIGPFARVTGAFKLPARGTGPLTLDPYNSADKIGRNCPRYCRPWRC